MKIAEYRILYSDGIEDVIEQEIDENNEKAHIKMIKDSFLNLRKGLDFLVLEVEKNQTHIITLSNVSRISLNIKTKIEPLATHQKW